MIAPRTMIDFVFAEPFRPFRIHMASGRTFDVPHPEMIRVGENSIVVFQYIQQNERVYEKFKMLGLNLIESIGHIDRPVAKDQD